ncbi:hypothetical protein I4F81_009198 [Pyropia yezoensis]|uniref:Uncharacterized protein n=1 Tax=Pyropia yezoensis TaxID=2788 RepID=A0ACC3CA40_PYRYE|nr:hypothetical protein I4F81_009198 [Neopyropia yezoensis]
MTSTAPTDVLQLAGEVAALLGPNVTAFILDPTGDQDANDVSELKVYNQWRWAVLTLLGYGVLMGGVVVQQLLADWGGLDLFWLLALMLAPWAPVADKVFRTLQASRRVMAMMRSRGCRNRLTAIMREYLAVGMPDLRPIPVLCRFGYDLVPPLEVPGWVVPDGVENKEFILEVICMEARRGGFSAGDDHSTIRERNEAHSFDVMMRAERLNTWDPLVRILSRRSKLVQRKGWAARWDRCRCFLCSSDSASGVETEMLSPFVYPPSGGTGGAGRADAEEQMDEVTENSRQLRRMTPFAETMLLDAIDGVLPGGTLSKSA